MYGDIKTKIYSAIHYMCSSVVSFSARIAEPINEFEKNTFKATPRFDPTEAMRPFHDQVKNIQGGTNSLALQSETLKDASIVIDEVILIFCLVSLGSLLIFTAIAALLAAAKTCGLFSIISRIMYVSENEFSSPRAIISLLVIMSSTVVLSALSPIIGVHAPYGFIALFITCISAILMLTMVPFVLIFNWGVYAPSYVKGQSIKKNVLIEVVTDYVHFVSFFLRVNIQLIRLVIVTAVFYLYNEMYHEFIYPNYNFESLDISPASLYDYSYIGLKYIVILVLNIIYEIGHFWILFMMQSGAFSVIAFVITQFLYTCYLMSRMQSFFTYIRNKNTSNRTN